MGADVSEVKKHWCGEITARCNTCLNTHARFKLKVVLIFVFTDYYLRGQDQTHPKFEHDTEVEFQIREETQLLGYPLLLMFR